MENNVKVLQGTKIEIRNNQIKRIENGKVSTYKDGKEYLISKGYNTINVNAFKTWLKAWDMKNLVGLI